MDVFFALPTFSPVLRCPFPNFDAAKRRVNVIFLRGEGKSFENKGVMRILFPGFARNHPCSHSQAFTLIVQSVNVLRRVGEEVKAKNEKLLRRRCAHVRASSPAGKRGACRNRIAVSDRGRKRAEATKQPPPFPSGYGGGGLVGAVVVQRWGSECRHLAEATPVPRCGRCTVREEEGIGGILRNPFRAPPSNGGGRWATGSR